DLNSTISGKEIKFTLNKATSVDENDSRVITSQAVFNEFKNYTKTSELGNEFLKKDGSNIDNKKIEFGKNVGIEKIELSDSNKSTTELVQAQALINYLKGEGNHSVKISDSLKTTAKGDHSVSIGSDAKTENSYSIAIGHKTSSTNRQSIAIGSENTASGEQSISIGSDNNVSGKISAALGRGNNITGEHSFSIGAYNKIEGNHTYVLGSNVNTNSSITDAIVLGNQSEGKSNTVSVGSNSKQRRIIYVADPQDKFDAVNKKYVDELKLTYMANGSKDKNKTVKLTDGLNFIKSENISVTIADDGNITHALNNNLKNIDSISGGSDSRGTKITLDANKTEISFNNSKLKELLEGEINATSNEAISAKQLYDLASKLGIDVNETNKTKFKTLTLSEFKLKEVNGTDGKEPKNVVEGLKNVTSKINQGFKFGADNNTSTNIPHYLGSRIDIVKLANGSENIKDYNGSNLITNYTKDNNGNAKIE
ncbi:hypothetical protein F1B92_08450, partial [Campylobacter sp. FMV-PI01]|nr:hypothetical protein [Campylobacter portucalensis]